MTNIFRPGLEFRNGRLLLFARYSLTVMRPWPEPLAWKRTTRKPFRPVRPGWVLLVPGPPLETEDSEISAAWRRKLSQFMAPVPPEELQAIGQFRARQWHMMALLARCPGALDLVHSTPALAFALASNWVFRETRPSQPMRTARRLVRLPQTEICDWLGFPARRATISALRKLRTAHISVCTLLNLRDALRDEEGAKMLRHCPVLCEQAVAIARRPDARRHFAPRLLAGLPAHIDSFDDRSNLRSLALFALLEPNTLRRVPADHVFRSMPEVEEYVGELHARRRCPPDIQFPAPPIPAADTIVPLTNSGELIAESDEMQHCAAGMHACVSAGRLYIYRVLAPERATVSLVRDDGGRWKLGELSGPRNAAVAAETRSAVYAWLGNYHEGASHAATATAQDADIAAAATKAA